MTIPAIATFVALTLASVGAPEPAPTLEPPAPALMPPPPQLPEVDPRNYNMVLAGNLVIGLGGAGLITMIAGLGVRSDALAQRRALGVATEPDAAALARQDRRIQTGTILAVTGGVATVALFTSGVTLVALGYARERKRRESLTWIPTPTIGRETVGLHWSIRFAFE